MMTLMAAAAIQMAVLQPGASWLQVSDYPQSALRNGEGGYVGFALLIGPDGRPDRCTVTAPVPSGELNSLTCRLAMRRAHFKPASNADGQAVYAVYRGVSSWLTADNPDQMAKLKARYPFPSDVDLTLSVAVRDVPGILNLTVAVDASGVITECLARDAAVDSRWIKAACGQIRKLWMPIAMLTKTGEAVATIQSVKVEFRSQAPTP
jgi:TonB family protein